MYRVGKEKTWAPVPMWAALYDKTSVESWSHSAVQMNMNMGSGSLTQVSQPPLASVYSCKMGISLCTLPTFWSYSEHHNKYFIFLSLYIHKVHLPHWIANFPGTRTIVLWGFSIFATYFACFLFVFFFLKLTSTKCLLKLKCWSHEKIHVKENMDVKYCYKITQIC